MKLRTILTLSIVLVPALVFAATQTYRVQRGDTWESIAAKNGITVQQLVDLNQPVAGDRINIPKVTTPTPPPPPVTPPPTTPPPTGGEKRAQVYDTFYGWPDNTPSNSSDLSVGGAAGGTGTFADPITAASGYVFDSKGNAVLDFPYGTKFYVPNERKYFVIGDECGDPPHPESKACHTITDPEGKGASAQIDLWAGGVGSKKGTAAGNAVEACEADHTRINTIIFNPASNYVVVPGNVYTTSCGQQYGDTPVTQ